jgi:uncharacterized membrane protein
MDHALSIWALITGLTFQSTEGARYFETAVRPVIEAKCTSCHATFNGQNWTNYETAKRAKAKINFRVFVLQNMPPANAPQLNGKEKGVLNTWIKLEK